MRSHTNFTTWSGGYIAIGNIDSEALEASWILNMPEGLVEHHFENFGLSSEARGRWLTSAGSNEMAVSAAGFNGRYVSLFGVQCADKQIAFSQGEIVAFSTFAPHVHRAAAFHARLSGQAASAVADEGLIQEAFGFTDAEAQVASQLLKGMSLSDIAESTSRSRETVKSHLKSLFKKTGTRRQAELVSLLSRTCFSA